MTAELRPWLDDEASLTAEELAVLRQDHIFSPPADAKARVWAALGTRLPSGPASGDGGSGGMPGAGGGAAGSGALVSAGKAVLSGGLFKSLWIGFAVGLSLIGGAQLFQATPHQDPNSRMRAPPAIPELARPSHLGKALARSGSPPGPGDSLVWPQSEPETKKEEYQPASSAPAGLMPKAPSSRLAAEPVGAEESDDRKDRADELPKSAPPTASFGSTSQAAPRATPEPTARSSALAEEARLVREARQALARSDASAALAVLGVARRRFPAGALVQERQALSIEALWVGGWRSRATDRARQFYRLYTTSPHVARLREIVGD